jgi:acetyl-CoA/propionyl-CoA carboxylase biotin carboxyl carrier protein
MVDKNNDYYFLEVNPRIQVEHPITEMVTGIDIVKWQLRIAAGETLDIDQADIERRGTAMEFRLNAENPDKNFEPTPGTLTTYRPPRGIGIRVDDGIDEGDQISPFYDSLFAKVVVAGSDRTEVLQRSHRALDETVIDGVETTIPFHQRVLSHPRFRDSAHTTTFVEQNRMDK